MMADFLPKTKPRFDSLQKKPLALVVLFSIFSFILFALWQPRQQKLRSETIDRQREISTTSDFLDNTISQTTLMKNQSQTLLTTTINPTSSSTTNTSSVRLLPNETTTLKKSATTDLPTSLSIPTPSPPSTIKILSAHALGALRECETKSNYKSVLDNNFGAYNFTQSTWDLIAEMLGRDDLIGVAPNTATVADQDAMALKLYEERGAQESWPTCGHTLDQSWAKQ